MKTPLTREKLRHHLTYCGWMYIALILGAIFGWNLIYQVSSPRIPADQQLTFYMAVPGADEQVLGNFMQKTWNDVFPELKDVHHVTIMGSSDELYTGTMQLDTKIFTQEGDVYLLGREDFRRYASVESMLPLDEFIEDGSLSIPEHFNLNKGYVTLGADAEEPGAKHLYAIPCVNLPGFKKAMGFDPSDMYLSVMAYTGNPDDALKFVQYLIDSLQ